MPKRIYDWATIQCFHDAGHGFVDCQKKFGFTHSAWIKAIARGELRSMDPIVKGDRRRKYDWAEIQAFYDQGNSVRTCSLYFGFTIATWEKARKRGEVRSRPATGYSLERLLGSPSTSRITIKRKLLKLGILVNRCEVCGISEWLDRPLACHVDHINGEKDDHRVENLRMLCPNCHSQTETYGGKNMKRRRSLHDRLAAV